MSIVPISQARCKIQKDKCNYDDLSSDATILCILSKLSFHTASGILDINSWTVSANEYWFMRDAIENFVASNGSMTRHQYVGLRGRAIFQTWGLPE
jgi:hypothetical protein